MAYLPVAHHRGTLKTVLLFSAIVCLFTLTACASTGTMVRPEQIADFRAGETTYQDVVDRLGPPNARTTYPDGSFAIAYAHTSVTVRPETLIPVIGAFVGGADGATRTVGFRFDKNGVLIRSATQDTSTSSNLGKSG